MTTAHPIVRLTILSISYSRYRRIATAITIGSANIAKMAMLLKAFDRSGATSEVISDSGSTAPASPTSAASHLTCWRWIASPCRKRVATAATAAPKQKSVAPSTSTSSMPTIGSSKASAGIRAPVSPSNSRPRNVQAIMKKTRLPTTHRYRGDGSRPSGNTSGTATNAIRNG